ncbi:MAG: cytochrome c biogenesis protein CcsA [Gammaproteobacteria bacterium]|jgi:ABC-type transport system involved in cytochrome c biogenesis permease subunit|nr:cytochrome c biogenesis protein CcsA [Gammaproteobacteria bacterium]
MNGEVVTELPWLYAGIASYALAFMVTGIALLRTGGAGAAAIAARPDRYVLGLLVGAVALLTISLAERWVRIGHGPFVDLFELLISQMFSLGLVYTVAYWRIPLLRPTAIIVLPVLLCMGAWVLTVDPAASAFPPTYYHDWKWAHVIFGKFFLAFCLIGTGLAGIILLRDAPVISRLLRHMPSDAVLDTVAWRFMLLALIFESLMLIAGAVWAQDAWGRYWAWDALETSSFINWLLLGIAIHVRFTYRVSIRAGAAAIIGIFVFAFFTYFGAPFYSEAAHKGVI